MKTNHKLRSIIVIATAVQLLCIMGCKKYDNPPPVYEELNREVDLQRKILIVSIDGLTGSELQKVAPPNIAALQKTGKYSYEVLNSSVATDAAGWATLIKGVGYSKHLVSLNTFDKDLTASVGDFEGSITSYRNVFDYITQFKSIKTGLVTPWEPLRSHLRNTDFSPVVSTDLAVKDSTVSILTKHGQLGALIVNFRDVESAGENGGYVASNPVYKSAIVKADEYIGNVMAALTTRKNYANENWLIIVTTNHGGSSAAPQNGFMIVSNKDLKQEEVKKSGYSSAIFKTTTSRAIPANGSTSLFDPGLTGDITVQMDTKFESTNINYPTFVSKSTNLNGGTITGWQWGHYGDGWIVTVGGSANGGSGKIEARATALPGTNWHTLTMTIKTTVNGANIPTARILKMYVDGNLDKTVDIFSRKSLANNEPFRIGHRPGDTDTPTPFYGANLQYFDIALDDATIKANANLKDITKHPNYANLVGFWPMGEGASTVLGNKIAGGVNLNLSGDFSWNSLATLYPPGTTSEPVTGDISITATSSDVMALSLYWMKINILSDYGIDGNPFLNKFEIEFLK